ncbi:MAG: hypothetical protein HY355_02220 [Armatimonadetes bacterium]|nr:hypothetical protein [Armatimonadota bacterium]
MSSRIWRFPLERITSPALFVHHRQDACQESPFDQAVRLRQRMTRSPRTDFIEVQGGDPPRSTPCEAMSPPGFLGKEREVVAAIADWIAGRPTPAQIGP